MEFICPCCFAQQHTTPMLVEIINLSNICPIQTKTVKRKGDQKKRGGGGVIIHTKSNIETVCGRGRW